MDATANFRLRFTRASDLNGKTAGSLPSRKTLQRITTRMSLLSLTLGFWAFAMLIVINRHQVEVNGFSGGSFIALVGGIVSILVGTAFLVAACLHWR